MTETTTMNPVVRASWTAALRSKTYKPGTTTLRQWACLTTLYSALGVLCDVYRRETGRGEWQTRYRSRGQVHPCVFLLGSPVGHVSSLPPVVQKWAGLSCADPLTSRGPVSGLSGGFEQIADLIEEEL